MNDKDARDTHRLAVGAGEAPTDAQIMDLACATVHCAWDEDEMLSFARAVLALSPPAIPEVVKSGTGNLTHEEWVVLWERHKFEGPEGWEVDAQDLANDAIALRALTTPPPAPSSPAPVAGNLDIERLGPPTVESELRFIHAHNPDPHYKGSTLWHRVEAALAAPSTVQGLSDAAVEAGVDAWFSANPSIEHNFGERMRLAYAAILANPAAPSPESGS